MAESPQNGALTPAQCREYLKAVIDPEIYQNIVDLGLVYAIEVEDDHAVIVKMTLTTPHCPMGPQIIENVEKTLLAKGARTVDVRIVWEPMWTPDAMTEELKRELGILPDTTDTPDGEAARESTSEPISAEEEEPVLEIDPPTPKKKGLLSRLFGG